MDQEEKFKGTYRVLVYIRAMTNNHSNSYSPSAFGSGLDEIFFKNAENKWWSDLVLGLILYFNICKKHLCSKNRVSVQVFSDFIVLGPLQKLPLSFIFRGTSY